MVLKNYCKLLCSPFLIALICLPLLLGQTSGYLSVGHPQKAVGKRNASVQVKIPLSVQPGFHVNSNAPNEEYLIPLKLTWSDTGPLQPGAVVYPKPTNEKYEFAEKPLSVLTGNFDVVANFKVSSSASAGPGAVTGKLRYQACNDRACFPPKTIDISIPYQIQ